MSESDFKYSEDILQWVWKNLMFDNSYLETTDEKPIKIFDQGILNITDGPDFLEAKISIDGVLWFGAVEIHLKSQGWRQHGHHFDDAYNKVILHVVFDDSSKNVETLNGEELPTLNLLSYLPADLSSFVSEFSKTKSLHCARGLQYISEKAFIRQLDKAHNEYLEKKGSDFLSFYNPNLLPSIAWKQALVLSVFDGFGITHNREAMQDVGRWLLNQKDKPEEKLVEEALEFSGFGSTETKLKWNFKGIFPANHPNVRIPQAVHIALNILNYPFQNFLQQDAFSLWKKWGSEAGLNGSVKMKILYGTVFIPALYMLGNLFAFEKLSKKASKEWQNYQVSIPNSVLRPYQSLNNIDHKLYSKRLGSVHQLNAYCEPRRCHECFVLKKVISS